MKPEKMTPEELGQARKVADYLNIEGTSTAHRLLAHIAAVEAERDEYSRLSMNANTAIQGVQDEANALRERVRAMEAERRQDDAIAEGAARSRKIAKQTQHDLATIRQRAGDKEWLLAAWEASNGSRFSIAQKLESVARSMVGEDPAGAGKVNACSNCGVPIATHPENDDCAIASEQPGWVPLAQRTSTEPTTAEAFATVRTALVGHSAECIERNGPLTTQGCDCGAGEGMAELSLLERRMGAMGRALREVEARRALWLAGNAPVNEYDTRESGVLYVGQPARIALTDAPLVFTEEEVERATAVPTWTDDMPTEYGAGFREGFERALASVRTHLAALRKGT